MINEYIGGLMSYIFFYYITKTQITPKVPKRDLIFFLVHDMKIKINII